MKAAVCVGFGQELVIEDVTLAPPGPGELRVKLGACAICHSDIFYIQGAWGGALPSVYGHEAAGIVVECGPGVRHVSPGDHVVVTLIRSCGRCHYCTQGQTVLCESEFPLDRRGPLARANGTALNQGLRTGAFAEEVVVDESQVVTVPKDLPFDVAALLACGVITGVGAVVNDAAVPAGSSVVVIGTGGVGLNAVQGAKLANASPIVAIDLAPSKLAAARLFGASHAIDPRNEDAAATVKSLTGGRGADYVFVTVGAKPAFEQGFGLLAKGGTLVVVGMPATGVMAEFDPGSFAAWGQRMIGSKMGSARVDIDIPRLVALYGEGKIKLDELISGRFPLDGINAAIAGVTRGEALRNVILF
ncbi:MAG: Zn-dependent alcohol dehydrogenase [Rhodospirillaceae bacterium]|nr:Zn-dependent alcohol dehydrogenase [Rhodospirillaceae bacterium]